MSARGGPTLRLYVAGAGDQSLLAIRAVRSCAAALGADARTEVIDAYQATDRAREDGVIVLPTAVWCDARGVRRIVSDLGDPQRLLAAVATANDDRTNEDGEHGPERSSQF